MIYNRHYLINFGQRISGQDTDGKTYVYSLNDGIVKTSEYNLWSDIGFGWDLLGK